MTKIISRTILTSLRLTNSSTTSSNSNNAVLTNRLIKGKFAEIHSDSIINQESTEAAVRIEISNKRKNSNSRLSHKLISPRTAIPSEVRRKPSTPWNSKVEVAAEDQEDVTPPMTNSALSILYTSTTPPPTTALSAFANRLALSTSNPLHSLAKNLPLLEQCLIHPSFWSIIPSLPELSPSNTSRKYTNYHDTPFPSLTTTSTSSLSTYAHNASLSSLGNAILGCLTSELILSSFPNLPARVQKAALTLYAGPKTLASVVNTWGIGPSKLDLRLVGDKSGDKGRGTRKEMAYGHLVGGVGGAKRNVNQLDGAGGGGLIRWNRKPSSPLQDAVLYEDTLSSVGRALIGAIYQEHGFAAARSFVHVHFLHRLLPSTSTSSTAPPSAAQDLAPLLKFTNPTLVLSNTLSSHSLPSPSHKLLRESGRLSSHPTFLTGVFADSIKLGEGFGSSLKMSEWRASEDALRRFYLGGKKVGGGLPSDAWSGVGLGGRFKGLELGETEVKTESAGRGNFVGGVGSE